MLHQWFSFNELDAYGIPTGWKTQYFGSTNAVNGGALDDWDHDGMNNWQEYLAGAVPTNASSKFQVTDFKRPGGTNFVIQWSSVAGKKYALQTTTNLLAGFDGWATNHVPATPPLNTHTVIGNQVHRRYYRRDGGALVSPAVILGSTGSLMQRFIKELASKKILAAKCPGCGYTYVPPRSRCGKCYSKIGEENLLTLSGKGTLVSYATAHVKLDGQGTFLDLEKPEIIGAIRLDNADSTIFMPIEGIKPRELTEGLKVRSIG